jgi:hypothetical protein
VSLMTQQYECALFHDTNVRKRPDWQTLEQTQSSKVLYDSQRKSNRRSPFTTKIKHLPSFTRGIPSALFTPQHQIFSTNAYSLVVFDGTPNDFMLDMTYGPFVACKFKLDEGILDQMETLAWAHELILRQSLKYDIINDDLNEVILRGIGSVALRTDLDAIRQANGVQQKVLTAARDEFVLKLKDLFNSGW